MKKPKTATIAGFTLPFAILISIVILCFSLLIISYFSFTTRFIVQAETRTKGFAYGYDGFNYAAGKSVPDNEFVSVSYPDGFNLHVKKQRWGAYVLLTSIVCSEREDTIFSKMLLAGLRPLEKDIALTLRNASQPVYYAGNVEIEGRCFIPMGKFRPYLSANVPVHLKTFKSNDSFPKPQNIDSLLLWLSQFKIEQKGTVIVTDSVHTSFANGTKLMTADSLIITTHLSGNIVLAANTVIFTSKASANHIIATGRSIFFSQGFEGSLQAIATDTIIAGKNTRFEYPNVFAVLPDIIPVRSAEHKNAIIVLKENVTYQGDLIGYRKSNRLQYQPMVLLSKDCTFMGGIYSSGHTMLKGNVGGRVVSSKLMDYINNLVQENMLQDVTLRADFLPGFYTFNTLFPETEKYKTVEWVQ